MKVVAESLRRHPRVNSSWRDGALVPAARINVALAVATDEALVVPVIHDADRLALAELAARRKALVAAARAGELRPADVSDGTFTISNLGMFGVDSFDAIVNAPQAGDPGGRPDRRPHRRGRRRGRRSGRCCSSP